MLWFNRIANRCRTMPVLVAHDEIVVECIAEQAEGVRTWLESAMVEGMDVILNGRTEVHVPIEVEARISESWGGG